MSLFGGDEKKYCENYLQYLNFDGKIERAKYDKKRWEINHVISYTASSGGYRAITLQFKFDVDDSNPPIRVYLYFSKYNLTPPQRRNIKYYLDNNTMFNFEVNEHFVQCDDLDADQAADLANYLYENADDILSNRDNGQTSFVNTPGDFISDFDETVFLMEELAAKYLKINGHILPYEFSGEISGYIDIGMKVERNDYSQLITFDFGGRVYYDNYVDGEDVYNNAGDLIRFFCRFVTNEYNNFCKWLREQMASYTFYKKPLLQGTLCCSVDRFYSKISLLTSPDLFNNYLQRK